MKWIFVIVTVVALIYLFLGNKKSQQIPKIPTENAGAKTIDGKGKDVLINTTAQVGNTVNGYTPAVMANSPSHPQMALLVVNPSPGIETGQRPTESNLEYI